MHRTKVTTEPQSADSTPPSRIAAITNALTAIVGGAYNTRLQCDGDDELAQLAKKVNELGEALELRLQRRVADLSAANRQLQAEIDQSNRTETELRATQGKYDLLLNSPLMYVAVISPQGVFQAANSSAADACIAGAEPHDIVGRNIQEFLDPVEAAMLMRRIETVVQSRSGGTIERRMRLPRDSRWMRIDAQPIHDDHGSVIAVHFVGSNVSDRRVAQNERREAENRYRALFAQTPDAIVLSDPKTLRVIEFNDAAATLVGYSNEEFMRVGSFEVLADVTERELRAHADRVLKAGTDTFTTRLRTKKGIVRDVEIRTRLIAFCGMPTFVAIMRDVTQREQTQEALRQSEARFRALFSQIPEAVVLTDPVTMKALECNDAATRLLGYSREELLRVDAVDVVSDQSEVDLREHADRVLSEGADSFTARLRTKGGGDRDVEVRAGLVTFDGKPAFLGVIRDVTEREQTQEALRQSEARFRSLFETAHVAIGMADARGCSIEQNPAFARMFGYTDAELRGRPLTTFIHPDDHDPTNKQFADLVAGRRKHLEMEKRYLRKDGSVFWGNVSVSAVCDRDGRFLHSVGIIKDITESKLAAERIQEQARVLRSILESVPEGVVVADESGRIILFNAAAQDFAHVWQAEPDYASWPEGYGIFLADKITHCTAEQLPLARALRGEFVKESELFVRHPRWRDGIWLAVTARPLTDDATNIRGAVLVCREITQRKRWEDALRESEEQYRQLLENLIDGVALLVDGRIVYVNEPMCRLTGYPAEEMMGHYPTWFFLRGDRKRAIASGAAAIGGRRHDTGEYVCRRKDGTTLAIEGVISPIRYAGKPALLGVIRDITERKQAAEQLRNHELQLAHVTRLSTMGEMATGIAHELNQPLTAIASYAYAAQQLLADGARADEASLGELLENLTAQVARAGNIVRRLRDFVRKAPPKRTLADFNEVIREVLQLVEPDLRQHEVKLDLDLTSDAAHVAVDVIQMQQVLVNLMRNAVDAMESTPRADRRVQIATVATGNRAADVTVSDRGKGLAPGEAERIFEAFYTTKPDGIGMGLAISRSIIEAHGGQLVVEPNVDCGVTFRMILPAAPDDTHEANTGPRH